MFKFDFYFNDLVIALPREMDMTLKREDEGTLGHRDTEAVFN